MTERKWQAKVKQEKQERKQVKIYVGSNWCWRAQEPWEWRMGTSNKFYVTSSLYTVVGIEKRFDSAKLIVLENDSGIMHSMSQYDFERDFKLVKS